jgi:hypothetical protein
MTVFGIILFALVALGILLFVTRLSWEDVKNGGGYGVRPYLDAIGKQFIFTLLGGVCFVGFFVMTFLITYIKNDEYTGETEKCYIHSINLSHGGEVTGAFVLGIGEVYGEMYRTYNFYTKTEDNVYELKTIKSKNFKIVCTDTVEPHIEYYNKGISVPKNILFKDTFYYDIEMEDSKGIIYLPSNAIIQNYQIKL